VLGTSCQEKITNESHSYYRAHTHSDSPAAFTILSLAKFSNIFLRQSSSFPNILLL
jgi:hypothetical protein